MRKWFIFGVIVAIVGVVALFWYLNREDEDVQAITENLLGKVNRGVSGTRETLGGLYGRIRGRVSEV
ncbi:MAG: hypothetical protein IPN71_21045 [Fibrobacteres bacterium]|jgi:hypothetical protein|nr:hypothetical protein [Fibrobacterota bacterium]